MSKFFSIDITCKLNYKIKGEEKTTLNYLGGLTFELGNVMSMEDYLGTRYKFSNIISMIHNIREDYLPEVWRNAMEFDNFAMRMFYIDEEYRLILPGHNAFYNYGKLGFIFNDDQKEEFEACKKLLSTERVKTEIIELLKDTIFLDYVIQHPDSMRILPDEDNDDELDDVPPAGVNGTELGVTDLSYEYEIKFRDQEPISVKNIGVLDQSKA